VDDMTDDMFWYLDESKQPHLRPIVRATIEQLRVLPACRDQFHKLLEIISSLLNTNHLRRPAAGDVYKTLQSLVSLVSEKIKENSSFYLLPENSRPSLDLVIDDDRSKYTEDYTTSPSSIALS